MKKFCCCVAIFCFISVQSFGYIGELTVTGGGLDGTGFWITDNGETEWFPAELSWEVTQDGSLWNYSYTLEVYRADVSHFIIETSSSFGSGNLFDAVYPGSEIEIQTHTSANGNPYIPGDVYGAKFDIGDEGVAEPDYTTITVSFDSDRDPIWGDFYAKCGAVGGTQNTVWNEGFLVADPLDAPADGTVLNHVLVPDTIPEPATLVLLGLGSLALLRRRK